MEGASGWMLRRAAGRGFRSVCRASTTPRYLCSSGAINIEDAMAQTILVVDDEPRLVDLVTSILEDQGYAVIEANDGDAALAAVRERMPDLVLLDVMLPGMDGFAILK